MACNYKFIILILLLLNSLFFNLSNAASELVERVCKQSNDNQYCLSALGSDPRSDSLDLHALGLLSIQMNIIVSLDTLEKFPELRKNITDGQKRLDICHSDFETASNKFREAFSSADKKNYSDAKTLVADGTSDVFDCRIIYKWSDPVGESPVSGDIQKINSNTVRVINTVLDMLIGN